MTDYAAQRRDDERARLREMAGKRTRFGPPVGYCQICGQPPWSREGCAECGRPDTPEFIALMGDEYVSRSGDISPII